MKEPSGGRLQITKPKTLNSPFQWTIVLQCTVVAKHNKGGTVVTHLDAVTIAVMLVLALMVRLTSVLFKECLHRAIQSRTHSLSPFLYTLDTIMSWAKLA